MKIYIERIIINNRAPFENIDLVFNKNEISILTAVNGSGKTTLLSYIVDAWHEMARPHFVNEFKGKETSFYRFSSNLYTIDSNQPSLVYIRFKANENIIDYIDVRNKLTQEQYDYIIKLENKIPFDSFQNNLNESNLIKLVSPTFDKKMATQIFFDNIITYFPAYRFEMPGYLNDPYKVKLNFNIKLSIADYLKNPIEVVTGLPQLANWIMDIVLDGHIYKNVSLLSDLNKILSQILISKKIGNVRLGIGQRYDGGSRIQIMNLQTSEQVYPSIFNLSSGESAMLCLFGEILRQADNNRNNIPLSEINGIVLIDEADKHLHIKLQKEILPQLLMLFPNVQFILSSHSPFLNMGLAEIAINRTKIIDLDNMGISTDATSNELYTEVYNMMIDENERFKETYQTLQHTIIQNTKPLIITEGKTDVLHLRKAKDVLGIEDCDVDFYDINSDWGDSKLKTLLEYLSKVRQSRKIIGIFDRDVDSIIKDIEKEGQLYKNYSNNVYAFCIPIPAGRDSYKNISIEFYYSDNEIKKEKQGRSIYFDNEVDYLYNKSTNHHEYKKLETPRREKEFSKKIFDEQNMCDNNEWIHSKANFAHLIANDVEFSNGFDFSKFIIIFDRIKQIIQS